MKNIKLLAVLTLCLITSFSAFAQRGGGASGLAGANDEFLPNAIYEVRYWTNMAAIDDNSVYIDTMVFFGADRAVFNYSSSQCISYGCRDSDSLIYVLLPKFGIEKKWDMGESFVRKDHYVTVPFRGHNRTVYRIYTAEDDAQKKTGQGNYAIVSREFGIIYRYNSEGEVFMLNRIDVLRNGKIKDEIDLLPLHMALGQSDVFSGTSK